MPAFDALLALLKSDDYVAAAPEAVGLAQYPGGAEAYAALVRMHTTLDLTSDRVHAIGLERMADIRSQMQQLLDEAGFAGRPTDYLEQVKRAPRWRASGAEEDGAAFQRYIRRISPTVERGPKFNPQ